MGGAGRDGRRVSRDGSWFARLIALFGEGATDETWHDLDIGAISESDRFLLDTLPFERITTSGNRAMAAWQQLRREGRFYPVIVGDDQELMRVTEQWGRDDVPPEQILARAAKLSHPDSLFALREADSARARAFIARHGETASDNYEPPPGEWPDEDEEFEPNRGPSLILDSLTREPLDRIHILLMPVKHGHEVPALLRWGGWNECPPSEHHVATLRHWEKAFGAELVGLSGDILELRVAKRPQDRGDALRLAREHYVYCNDILDQGPNDLATLAALLAASDWWHFWWD
jgi:hypothetical protein